MTTTITAPSGFTGRGHIGPLVLDFTDGVCDYDGDLPPGAETYMLQAGYGINGPAAEVEPAPAAVDLNGQPVDSRNVEGVIIGTELRDAAVDPRPEDFLPPINAGNADPQGPEVASPQIHAAETKVVVPGAVGVFNDDGIVEKDLDVQAAKENTLAERTLVGDEPVPDVTAAIAAAHDDPTVDNDGTAGDEKPKGNASRDEWVDYAKQHGASDDDLDGKSRDEIRDSYTD